MSLVGRKRVTVTANDIGLHNYVAGYYFSETGGTNSITVKVYDAVDTSTAANILWQVTVPANGSVGEDYSNPYGLTGGSKGAGHVSVAVTGSGTCEGHVRGR